MVSIIYKKIITMKTIYRLALGALFLGSAAAIASCSESKNEMIGSWTAAAPQAVVPTISGTVSATEVTSFVFDEGTDKSSGPVKMTTDYNITLPADSLGNPRSCTVKASVSGRWTRDEKDDDDYYMAFDRNTLDVAAVDADDLGGVTDAFLGSLARYTAIDDVEVNKDGSSLVFEVESPDAKLHFIRVK